MANQLPLNMKVRIIFFVIAGNLAISVNSQTSELKWDRDTIVEKEYQPSYCQNNPEKTTICSDGFSITQSGPQQITIDSIYFKVTTLGIISSHATLNSNQSLLRFAYHSSGNQAGYPWKFSEYNDSGHAKISINPFQKIEFTGFEIDNCLFTCPLSRSASASKVPVTGILIFVSKTNKRDTLTLIGLQSQESVPIYRRPRSGVSFPYPKNQTQLHNTKGQLVGLPVTEGSRRPVNMFPYGSH